MALDRLDDAIIKRGWRMACALTRSADDAEEVLQQAMIVAWRNMGSIPDHVWPWFATIVRNCWRNHIRATARVRAMDRIEDYPACADSTSPADVPDARDLHAMLHRELLALPRDEREAVTMCFIGGMTQPQAGRAIGVNVNVVRARVARGVERLRLRLRRNAASLESYLAAMAFAPPVGGFEASIARWKETAIASGPPATGPFLSQAFTAAAVAAGVGVLMLLFFWFSEGTGKSEAVAAEARAGIGPGTATSTAPGGAEQERREDRPRGTGAATVGSPEAGGGAVRAGREPQARPRMLHGAYAGDGLYWHVKPFYPAGPTEFEWLARGLAANAVKHGLCLRYSMQGQLLEEGRYEENLRQGEWLDYHENGEKKARGSYKAGNQNGFWTYWHDNGSRLTEGVYENGPQVGIWNVWRADGTLERTRVLRNGKLHGWLIAYDQTGRKESATLWLNGKATARIINLRLDPEQVLPSPDAE